MELSKQSKPNNSENQHKKCIGSFKSQDNWQIIDITGRLIFKKNSHGHSNYAYFTLPL